MSTRGDYTVVKDGHYYSCYQHTDMYPEGHPVGLFAEAADIARNQEWDEVIDGWITKAWVDHIHDERAKRTPAVEAAASSHPDGDTTPARWVWSLRPRLSRAELAEDMDENAAAMVFDADAPHGNLPISGHPSWRAAAAMPVMMKCIVEADSDRAWGVVVDADNRQVVLLDYRRRGGMAATAPMDDPDALAGIADALADTDTGGRPWQESAERLPPSELLELIESGGIADGQWRRPDGMRPLPGAPSYYPAERAGPFTPRHLAPRTAEQLEFGSPKAFTPPLIPRPPAEVHDTSEDLSSGDYRQLPGPQPLAAQPVRPRSATPSGSKRARILAAARANPKHSATQIARAAGASPSYTASVLKQAAGR